MVKALLSTGQLKSGREYDFDFDHRFIGTEKYDAKPTYKKFIGYSPGVAVIGIARARMDCGSCSEEIVDTVKAHCRRFYIRANRCSAFYDDMFALSGWKRDEINGVEYELNSILVEKWKGKVYATAFNVRSG